MDEFIIFINNIRWDRIFLNRINMGQKRQFFSPEQLEMGNLKKIIHFWSEHLEFSMLNEAANEKITSYFEENGILQL